MREMKNSGIEWIGEIPENWEISKIKYNASFYNGDRGKNYPSGDDMVDEGIPFLTSNNIHGVRVDVSVDSSKFISAEKYAALGGAKIQSDDIVYCLRGSVGNCAINKSIDCGTIASSLVAIRPIQINADFLNYLLHTNINYAQTTISMNGSCAANLSAENVSDFYIVKPSSSEQHLIVAFLDAKCAEIDTLTADIQMQIDTLEQYKRSVITEAVTKGLNPDAEMKDSGNQYWGNIPADWHLSDIKYLFEIVKRIAGREGYDILSVTQKGLKIKDISNNEGQIAESYANYQFVYPGDFVMNHMDLLTGWVDCSELFGVTSPDYRVFRLRDRNNNLNYYKYIMQTCYMNRIFYSLGQGVSNLGRWRLQTSSFNNFKVPVPPIEEQMAIADYLNHVISETNSIIETKKNQLSTLEEYKKSVIYEYVTGKKEVTAQ